MTEQDSPMSFEERKAASSIHQWADVDDYLERALVPEPLWEPFHELVFARSDYPKNLSSQEAKKFGKRAYDITLQYELLPTEAQALKIMFQQLIEQWLASDAKLN